MNQLIIITGPTAVGKTKLAVALAHKLNAEIISADSRQVYQNMDIGTGKDLSEYVYNGQEIPYHLIDILQPGDVYTSFNFQKDFYEKYEEIISRKRAAILCGGTGFYLEAAIAQYKMLEVPADHKRRAELLLLSQEERVGILAQLKNKLHNTSDVIDLERTIRAIEIEEFKRNSGATPQLSPVKSFVLFAIKEDRNQLRKAIEFRMNKRFEEGMLEEVEALLNNGLSHEQLNYYGLEYRYISQHIKGQLSFLEMKQQLLVAIRKYAKKQMTWFRRMEKNGVKFNWINANLSLEEKLSLIENKLHEF